MGRGRVGAARGSVAASRALHQAQGEILALARVEPWETMRAIKLFYKLPKHCK